MEFLGPLHPQITHAPIVLIIVSLAFDVVGRALDLEWWRKAATAMLLLGVLTASIAVLSGERASDAAEKRQGIPERTVDHHGDVAKIATWLGIGAFMLRAAARNVGKAGPAMSTLSLLLHLGSAVTIGVAAHRGGMLVFEHGAAVKVHGALLQDPGAADSAGGATDSGH